MYLLSSQTELLDQAWKVFGHRIFECGIHRHRAHECLWVLKGQIRVQVNEQVYDLSGGDVIVINGDVPHATRAASQDNIVICVQNQFDPMVNVDCGPWLSNPVQLASMNHLRSSMAHIWWEHEYRKPHWELAVQRYLTEIQLLFQRYFPAQEHPVAVVLPDQHKRLDALIHYLEQHYSEHISLSQLAEREGLSEAYLSRYFKEHTGHTFHRYLTLLRLEQSMVELIQTSHSIAAIALSHGFPSIKAYNTAFKREYNCTPGEFRHRKQQDPIALGRIYGDYDPANLIRLLTPWLDQQALYL
ncbi:AraC family transcriptional regulator [Gynuella sunshinyii]|uniref:AraC-type DNA-binding domain-containing protein n=1 Tax=Gynuella sunshinyii YC6258 TaxID=1445510 RepID=A0A0C5VC64_9GAMM|nr:AraC family transcriptional regulator [Gynuella sunshinyii]AJQ96945.1 araC-type DNA-binding domain-containing protein [Gynuella sunshinyii YC6258]